MSHTHPMIHSTSLRSLALLTVALVATAALGQTRNQATSADPDAPEVTACLEAVEKDFRTQRPSADDLVF
ncbi:MAG: hypothetical protein EP299_00785, partial [Acidobacteria bacterium]